VTSSDIGTVMPLHYKLINHKRSQNNENKKIIKILLSDVLQLRKTTGDNVLLKHSEEEISHLINTSSHF